jgi:hypothetical protein
MLKNEENDVIAHLAVGNQRDEDDVYVMNRLSGLRFAAGSSIVEDLRFDLEDIAESLPEEETTEN